MTLRVYNTLGGRKEPFEPMESGKVRMYVCGPTVYDSCHVGHARSVVTFDVIARYLEAQGFHVTYVRNFTDVDDKIINRANELGISCEELAENYIAEFYQDMDALNVNRATLEPRATEHIDDIIRVIEGLIAKGAAYEAAGDVFFAVEAFKDYGKLSGRRLEEMEAGARVKIDEKKRNPFDFALWKAAKPKEPSWDSPWGKGRPGWHIECSAMSSNLLGQSFDIHGGGKDLIFPHHENEIAQSEAAFDKPFARYWLHNGFVNINHEKMSKSLGNFLVIKELLTAYHPEAVRMFLLSSHYRSPLDFTDQALQEASGGLDRIYTLLERLEALVAIQEDESPEPSTESSSAFWKRFCDAMDDDFNSALAIGIIFEAVRHYNRLVDIHSPDDTRPIPKEDLGTLASGLSDLKRMGSILGLFADAPQAYFKKRRTAGLERQAIDPDAVEDLLAQRTAARQSKNWAEADRIRQVLLDLGVVLEDRPGGTVWKIQK